MSASLSWAVILSLVFLFYVLAKVYLLLQAWLSMTQLSDIEVEERVWPSVSMVVAARNEERAIELAMESLLSLDYPDLDVVVVNDRSTDRTGPILGQLQAN